MLVIKREELRSQLKELATRRNQLQEQRAVTSTAAQQKEIEARIGVIDARTAQLEQQLFSVNDQITNGIAVEPPSNQQFTYSAQAQDIAIGAAISRAEDAVYEAVAASTMTLLSLYVGWLAFRRFVWKRRAPLAGDSSAQLSQLQQSIDVIALEVERISEAQRYTAKILNERGLGAGEAQPVAAVQREPVGQKRS
jgi:hypothetical protein